MVPTQYCHFVSSRALQSSRYSEAAGIAFKMYSTSRSTHKRMYPVPVCLPVLLCCFPWVILQSPWQARHTLPRSSRIQDKQPRTRQPSRPQLKFQQLSHQGRPLTLPLSTEPTSLNCLILSNTLTTVPDFAHVNLARQKIKSTHASTTPFQDVFFKLALRHSSVAMSIVTLRTSR